MSSCVEQIAPLVVPDVVGLHVTQFPSFPNGRRLDDPVMDIILAVMWLDLNVHEVTLFPR